LRAHQICRRGLHSEKELNQGIMLDMIPLENM